VCEGGTGGRRRVNEGDEGEGIWLMDFIYKTKKPLANLLSWVGRGLRGREGGVT
jgi:hypothetical protein